MKIIKKLILFGDSITAGYKQGMIDTCFNDALHERLDKEWEILNAGIPGDNTENALLRVEQHVLKYHPEYVTLFFGINDVSKSSGISSETYRKNIEALIQLIGLERVILIGLPYVNPWLYQQDRELEDIERYNQVLQTMAMRYAIPFIDLFSLMQETGDPLSYLQSDGLHFSVQGYALLAKAISKDLNERNG